MSTDDDVVTMAVRVAAMCQEHGADNNGFSVGELTGSFRRRMAFGRIARHRLDELNIELRAHGIVVTSYAIKGGLRTARVVR